MTWDLHARVISERHAGSAQPMMHLATCSSLTPAAPCSRSFAQRGSYRGPAAWSPPRSPRHVMQAATLEKAELSSQAASPPSITDLNQSVREGDYEIQLVELQVRQLVRPLERLPRAPHAGMTGPAARVELLHTLVGPSMTSSVPRN